MNRFNPQKNIVSLNNINKFYGNKLILNQINLDVFNSEFITILGPSGCGKTTLLRIIAGFEKIDSGQIIIDDETVNEQVPEKRTVNTVFQSYALFPHMNVFENVAFGLKMKRVKKEDIKTKVINTLKMVQLESYYDKMPSQLSGGQQQRVAIARAVINEPKVLLLDESLSALDYKLRKRMQLELKQLQRKLGITFIFVTHDQEEALSMSDRIVVLKNGQIEQIGSPKEIYENPNNLFVAKFIGEINIFDAIVVNRVNDEYILINIESKQKKIKYSKPVKNGQKLKVLLRPEDIKIKEIKDIKNLDFVDTFLGHVNERTYKGSTLESIIELESGLKIMVSEFFNEDEPDVDHKIGQKVSVDWIENWEVILENENENENNNTIL
ncbi:spermidine/putrescine ABC transporter ATP-binding protein PotA [Paraphotobacterium marinum]|uniref:spermidine/putrescine ABC transporter ATP-binding protein PotA n=1 Tax=Paraphotobacterium marinum TaxID=1755811 RepID=UPI001CEF5BAE|nr:spermidine/putrescine ABC transporter ATP-binding protein PotA [Paraphotobacterium marinum]